MKHRFSRLIVFTVLLAALAGALPLKEVSASSAPVTLGTFTPPPIMFEETGSYVKLNNSAFIVEFYKDSAGYNKIYNASGDVIVYDERHYLEYWRDSSETWNVRGIPYSLTWVKVSDYHYNVTRHYTDYIGTDWNITFIVRSGEPIKSVVVVDSGQTDSYRISWQLSGVTFTDNISEVNGVDFGSGQLGIYWDDVFESFGNITTASVESHAQGRKLTVSFTVGEIAAGSSLVLDPAVDGSTTPAATGDSYQRRIVWDGTYWWLFYHNGTGWKYKYSSDLSTIGGGATVEDVGTGGRAGGISVTFDGSTGIQTFYGYYSGNYKLRERGGTISGTTISWDAATFILQDGSYYTGQGSVYNPSDGLSWVAVHRYTSRDVTRYRYTTFWASDVIDTSESVTTTTGGIAMVATTTGIFNVLKDSGNNLRYSTDSNDFAAIGQTCAAGYGAFSVVSEGDVVHLAYLDASNNLEYIRWSGSAWGDVETIMASASDAFCYPVITLDDVNGELYVFWGDVGTDDIYYRKRDSTGVSGNWDGSSTTLVDESDLVGGDTSGNGRITAPLYANNSQIPVMYTIGSSPYTVKVVELAISSNSDPTITSASSPDLKDTDNMYGMDGYYSFQVVVNDADGATDIDKVYLQAKSGETVRWEVRATSLTGTPSWAIQTGDTIIDITTSSWSEDGNSGTATFEVRAEFDHPGYADLELAVYVEDSAAASAGWTDMQTDYFDIINRVVVENFAASDTRHNVGGTVTFSGNIYYATTVSGNTASSYYPADALFTGIDIHDASHANKANDLTIVNGAFTSSAVTLSSSVTSTNYHVYLNLAPPYVDADAPDGDMVAVVSDRIELVSVAFDDSRIDVSGGAEVRYVLRYDYDDVAFEGTDGSIVGFTWDAVNSWWDKAITGSGSVTTTNYDESDLGAITDSNYGLTAKENDAGANIITDRTYATATAVSDTRVNGADVVTVDWTIKFEYDDELVTSGTHTIEGRQALHQGSGVWRASPFEAAPTSVTFNQFTSSGNTYGITVENANGQTDTVIWDRIHATATSVSDTRDNVGDTVTVDWTLKYDYDEALVTDGTVTIEGVSASHQGSGVWRISPNYGSVTSVTYNEFTATGNAYGITAVDANGQTDTVIWDRIHATATAVNDSSRIDVYDTIEVEWTLKYDHDESAVTDGSVWIEGIAATHQGSGVWQILRGYSIVTSVTWNEFTASANTHGISAVDANGQTDTVIWDQIEVVSVAFDDSRIDVSGSAEVRYVLRYDHDDVEFGSGNAIVGFTWDSVNSWWDKAITGSASVTTTNYDENDLGAITDANYGLTYLEEDAGTNIITDRVEIYYEELDDSRVNININIEYRVKARLDYDNHELGTGDSVTANSGAMAWDSGNGWFDDQRTTGSVGDYVFSVSSASEATYGITSLWDNAPSRTGIWDRIEIVSVAFDDSRVNIGANAEVRFTLRYDYDDVAFTDAKGSITGYTFDTPNGWWEKTVAAPGSPGSELYDENDFAVTDSTYGLTAEEDDAGASLIGDRINFKTATLETTDAHINSDATGEWYAELLYEYDSAEVTDGTVTLNTGSMSWDSGGDHRWEHTNAPAAVADVARNIASVSGNAYGITSLNTAVTGDSETIEFDEVVFQTGTFSVTDGRVNYNANGEWYVKLMLDNNDEAITSGTITLNTGAMSYDGGDTRWEYTNSKGSVGSEARNIASVSGLTGGITKINAAVTGDSETVIFDRVHATATTASDNRDDINDNVNIDFTLKYDYDEALLTDGTVTIEGFSAAHQGSGVWRITKTSAAVTAVTYNEFTSSGNAYGVTAVDMDGQAGEEVIWDRIEIVSVAFSDSRINVGGSSEVRYVLRYDYDDVQFDSGKGSITGFTWDGVNSWWDKAITGSASVTTTNYDESDLGGITDATYGITAVENDAGSNIITDRVHATLTSVSDTRDNVGDTVTVDWTLKYDYDEALVTDGTVTIEGVSASHQGSGVWRISPNYGSVTSVTYNEFTATGNAYGITAVDANGQTDTVIWDRIHATATAVNDSSRIDVYDTIEVEWTLKYDHDESAVTDGSVWIEGIAATHQGSGVWQILRGYSIVTSVTWNEFTASANTHGISAVDANGQTDTVIWDQIEVVSVAFDDSRIDVSGSAEVRYVLRYDHDDVEFGSGNAIVGFTWDSVNSWWDKAITGSASVTTTNYDENDLGAITDANYGLTYLEEDAGTNIITDRVEIYYEELDDSRVNININIEYRVKARLDYDNHELGTGDSVTANSGAMAWDSGNGWFDDQRTTGSVGDYVFSVSSASEATYGITSLWDNAPSRTGIWDRIEIVSVAFDDSRVNIGANAEVRFTLRYDYDDVAFTDAKGSITGYTFDTPNGWWEKTVAAPGSPGSELYDENDFAVTDSTYGLTAEEDDAGASLIGDRINFKTATLETTDAHINSDATGEWYAELLYEYDSAEVTDGTVTLNTGSMSWDSGGDHRWEHTNAPAAVADVARNIASVSGNAYGITSLNTAVTGDSETIEFDEVVFQTGTFSVTDGRVNYNANGEWYVKLMLDNNDEAITSGTITLNTGAMSYDGGDTRWEYTNSKGSVGSEARNIASVSGLTGGITKINAAVTGDSETVIFDRVHATATTASDNRDDINDNVNIDFTLKYDYDEALLTDGTVTIEGFSAAHQGSGVWRITKTSAAVTAVTYNEFTSSGNAYGVTAVDMDGQAGEEVIWDRIEIVSVAFSDSRINVGGSSEVRYVLRYDYDDVQFDSGKGSITGFTWDGVNSWWDKAITGSGSVTTTNWDESDFAVTDSTYGLTAEEDDAGANIITDRVEIYYEAVDDPLVLKNENIEYRIKARLDYDDHELGTGDSVTANSGAMAWDAVNSWFDDQRTQATVGSYLFDVTAASEATHGITALYEPQTSPTGYWKDTPSNDAADSDATFDVDIYGWVNVTVTDEDLVANLATVEVQVTTSGSEVFTLRWTQSSGVFSEQSDASGVCTLDVSGSTRVNVDADTDRIGFRFKLSAGAQMGAVSVQATTIDDDAYSDQDPYSSEFSVNWYGEITVGDGSHSWSSLSPGDSQQTLDAPVDTDIDVTVSSNGAFDLQGKVNQAPTSGAYTIPLANLLIHEDTVGSASALTTGYVDIGGLTSQSRGLSLAKSFKLWLTVPNPQQDGSYTYTLSVQIATP